MRKYLVVLLVLVSTATITACGGGGGGGGTTTYSISGTVTLTGAGLPGVAVTLNSSTTVTTDGGGNYSFTGLANGDYTITPSRTGYTFDPVNSMITMNGANMTGIDFTATAAATTYSISGTVTLTGAGLSGVTISLNGTTSTITDASGKYSIGGLANGVYTLAPSRTGYTFDPVNRVITVNGANMIDIDFTAIAAANTYSLVGRVTVIGSGVGLQGATITLNTLATAITDTNGEYTFSGLANGSYTVTPSHASYTFSPISWSQTISGSNVTAVNFIATPVPDPTRAIVKFSTSANSTLIGAIDLRVALPTGVTVKTAGTSTVDPGAAFPSGKAASKSELFLATYSAASGTYPGAVHAMLGSTAGFSSGEFVTLVADLTPGVKPTASDFVVRSLSVYGIDTLPVSGVIATASMVLQGGGAPSKGRLKLVTSGTATTVSGVAVTIKLPPGVTVSSTQSPPATDPGVVFASGNAVSNSFTAGNYNSVAGTVHVALINTYGFAPGEFATVICDLSPGSTPVATDFIIQSATLYGLYSPTSIIGATADRTVTME